MRLVQNDVRSFECLFQSNVRQVHVSRSTTEVGPGARVLLLAFQIAIG